LQSSVFRDLAAAPFGQPGLARRTANDRARFGLLKLVAIGGIVQKISEIGKQRELRPDPYTLALRITLPSVCRHSPDKL